MASRLLMTLQVVVSPPHRLGGVPHGTRVDRALAAAASKAHGSAAGSCQVEVTGRCCVPTACSSSIANHARGGDGALIYMNSFGCAMPA